MFSVQRWAPRVAGVMFCALVGAVWVPGVAHAIGGTKFAVVSAAGTLARGTAGTTASRLTTGTYEVTFASNQTACMYVATSGQTSTGSVSGPIVVTVAGSAGNAKGLSIQTWDQTTGVLADRPFHVTTYCGIKPIAAVVGSSGALVRGSHVVSADNLSAGNYEVVFDQDVHKCAFTASLGATGSADSISAPGQVTVAGRAGNFNGVFVRTMNRAGTPTDFSFHLAVDCGARKVTGVIKSDGSKVRGRNVVSSANIGTGQYEVIFNRDVTLCSYTAALGRIGNSGAVSLPLTITTASRATDVNGVYLFVHDVSGEVKNEAFHLTVTC